MLHPFSAIVRNYRVVFFDAYGVLKNSGGVMEGAPELLSWLMKSGKDVYILTNDASKSPSELSETYVHHEHGRVVPSGQVISSGLLAKEFLRAKVRTGIVAYLGGPRSAFYIRAAGLEAVPVSEVGDREVTAVAFMDDEGFDWFRDLNATLNLLRTHSVPVIVANSDLSYPSGSGRIGLAIGSLANMLEPIVGRHFIRFGKPDSMMFSYAFALASADRPDLKRSQVLMVGDTLDTDIVGANTFGLDTALVLSGNTLQSQAFVQIQARGITPTFVCESVLT